MTPDVSTPTWTVLLVDDEPGVLEDTAEVVRNAEGLPPLTVLTEQDFERGLGRLTSEDIDVVILDVADASGGRSDTGHGLRVFQSVKQRRFLPVIFNTGNRSYVDSQAQDPLVQVVSKGDGPAALIGALQAAFTSGLPMLTRGMSDHVREVLRDYLWHDVAPIWAGLADHPRDDVAHLLTGRLARSLVDGGGADLAVKLGAARDDETGQKWHPSRMYVIPALGSPYADYWTGDLLRHPNGDWWLLMQPACDFAQRKAEYVLLVRALNLQDVDAFKQYVDVVAENRAASEAEAAQGADTRIADQVSAAHAARDKRENKRRDILAGMLSGTQPRYFHFPAFLGIPDLLVDLQRSTSISLGQLAEYRREASLNPPYTQALVAKYTAHVGRIGLPDPPVGGLVANLVSDILGPPA